ncbi:MAG: BMP family protein [Zestosphaera sp.]
MALSKTFVIAVVVIIAIVAGLTGYYVATLTRPPITERVKIAFIFPGSVTDTAWNEAGYRAMEAFRGRHPEVDIAWVQGVYDPAQIESTIRSYVEQGFNLIIGVGFQFGEPMAKIAGEVTREVYFLAIAGAPQYKGPKVSVGDVRTDQSCFVAAYIASKVTKTGHIGYVAGMAVAELSRCEIGLRKGLEYVGLNPDQVLHVVYTGDFHDVPKAKLATTALVEQYRVDVVKTMGDGCQLGGISGAKDAGVYVMMSGTYHPEIYPEGLLLAEIWDWSVIFEQFYQDYLSGKLKTAGGQEYWLSLENGGLKLASGGALPSEIWSSAQEIINKIISGQISTGFTP